MKKSFLLFYYFLFFLQKSIIGGVLGVTGLNTETIEFLKEFKKELVLRVEEPTLVNLKEIVKNISEILQKDPEALQKTEKLCQISRDFLSASENLKNINITFNLKTELRFLTVIFSAYLILKFLAQNKEKFHSYLFSKIKRLL